MVVTRRSSRLFVGALLTGTALAGGIVLSSPAAAQDAARLQAIQAQISQLQTELRRLQREAAQRDASLKQARDEAAAARDDAREALRAKNQAAIVGSTASLFPPGTAPVVFREPKPGEPVKTVQLGGVSITLGGYLDLTGLYRGRNLTSGANTAFNAIPFKNNPNSHTGEFRETAQQTRFSVLVEAKPTSTANVAGYLEMDLNGAATTSNSAQSNSYTPRLRHAYVQYDDSALSLHVLAGQTWSLLTPHLEGLVPRRENIPPTIDANYLPGFTYTRSPQIRVAEDFFNKKLWLGISLETPQAAYSFTPTTPSGSPLPGVGRVPSAGTITYANAGGSFLNSSISSYSIDVAPDIVVKAAFDPGFGHYEVYGLGRWFKTRVSLNGGGNDRVVFGGGIGGATVIPVWPGFVDLSGNILAGYGVGRYGAGQLPDASFKGDGSPAPLPELIGNIGVIGHPVKQVDLYSYVGMEQIGRSTYTTRTGAVTTGNGYGTAYAAVGGCDVELGSCNAQTRALFDVTAGGWWRVLHGGYGTVSLGAQYSYVKRIAFHGAGNASGSVGSTPKTDDNIVFFSVRYQPFQ